jgi:hypothetical protein
MIDLDKIKGIGIYKFDENCKIDLELIPTILIAEEVDLNEKDDEFSWYDHKGNIRFKIYKF